jgi:hypothetical protein
MPVRVVKTNPRLTNCTLYIGRNWAGLSKSVFHNPFHVGKDGTREEVLLKFIEYWYATEQKSLRDLALYAINVDKEILGCWCKPLDCHGDIIAGYVMWKCQEPTLW